MIDAKVLTIGFDAISKKMSENRMHKQHAAFPPGPFQVPSGIQVSFFIKKQPILTDCFL